MTRDDILKRYPNASESFLRANSASGARDGACAIHEKQQAYVFHESSNRKVDGHRSGRYRVTITLGVSDKRIRDADGAVTTLLDVLTSAIGRCIGMDRRALRKLASRQEGRGRRNNRH